MKRRRDHLARYIALGAVFVIFCLIFIARLINIQIAGKDYYTPAATTNHTTRTLKLRALRGEIYDRNGVALVKNKYYYDVYFDAGSLPAENAKRNAVILSVVGECAALGESDCFSPPSSPFADSGGVLIFEENYMSSVYGKRLRKLLGELAVAESADAPTARAALYKYFGITNDDGSLLYSDADAATCFALRCDMYVKNFSEAEPYIVLSDVSMKLLITLKENAEEGVAVWCQAQREYCLPGVASHILGRVGKIPSEMAQYYTSEGYPLDAIVGIAGAEQSFEAYLHGIDGELTIVEDEFGNVVDQYVSKEPVAGSNVYLTIDIEMQKVAERAVGNNIKFIKNKAEENEGQYDGEDASTGALTAVNPSNGEVMALASYPTYDLTTFSENYAALSADPLSPMFNRALEGTYAPGSTFKIGVAAAALMDGVITPTEIIDTKGQYKYYDDFQPRCWINLMYGTSHGKIAITEAIQVSCNYFFYEVGRRLGIEKMNSYCKSFGLGQPTGIELAEKTGALSGPEYRAEHGLAAWSPGDTLQAAIGQMDNVFTPLQISMYLSTIVNGGDRYRAHILYEVREFYTDRVIYKAEPSLLSSLDIPDNIHTLIQNAMRDVIDNGSAARVFANYAVSVGGKTGTAQVSETKSPNAVFMAFAPFDSPELVVSVVIEQGNNGADAGYAARDVFDYAFGIKSPPYVPAE